jgi:hypothetical protein
MNKVEKAELRAKCKPAFGPRHRRTHVTEWARAGHGVCTATIGAIGELKVCVDLLKKGYAVFRSVSPACFCDLVIAKDGRLTTVEVRTGKRNARGELSYPHENRAEVMAIVLPDEIIYLPELERKQG